MESINVTVTGPTGQRGVYKNIVLKSGLSFAEQISEDNAIYHVKWNYDLNGQSVTMPNNAVLKMEGGRITNGTLVGKETLLEYDTTKESAFVNVKFDGTWENIYSAKVDNEDLSINNMGEIQLADKEYDTDHYSGLGRVYLRKNIISPSVSNVWATYRLIEEGDINGKDILVYINNGKFHLPYRNVKHKKVLEVVSESSVDDLRISDQSAFLRMIQDLGIVDDTQYLYFDDDYTIYGGYPITMPDNSIVIAEEVVDENWPLGDYEDYKGKNLLTQEMINKSNTIYIILYDFDLNGQTVTIPEGCVLKFEGGSLNNGRITLTDTKILPYYNDLLGINLTVDDAPAAGTLYKRDSRPFLSIHDGTSWVDVSGFTPTAQAGQNRPINLTFPKDCGFSFFDRTLNKPIWALATDTWIESDTVAAGTKRYGSSTERPESGTLYPGFVYFDETLGYPITWNGNNWIEQDGAAAGVKRSGGTALRPAGNTIYIGFRYFDDDLGKTIVAKDMAVASPYVVTWVEEDGAAAGVLRSGITDNRPSGSDIYTGFMYLDTTLLRPIWYTGLGWVDATGDTV